MNLHEDKQTFFNAVVATANALNIKRHFVEKDYWICRSLQQMARTDTEHHAIFKGGTFFDFSVEKAVFLKKNLFVNWLTRQ